jgi:CRP-like cAMP-binding protein
LHYPDISLILSYKYYTAVNILSCKKKHKEARLIKPEKKLPPVVRLQYAKDDLIIKEGDYGISIYEIISGKVGIFVDSGGMNIMIATQGPGMIIGEMVLLAGNAGRRSTSARALENCCLESLHPTMLLNAYKQMPTILRLITNQALRIQVRMNKMVSGLSLVEGQPKGIQSQKLSDQWVERRKFYRKTVSIECIFRPVNSPKGLRLKGRIRNISREGLHMVVDLSSSLKCTSIPGDEFLISAYLMPDQKVNMTTKVLWSKKGETAKTVCLGIAITHMTIEDQRKLGFFLMP